MKEAGAPGAGGKARRRAMAEKGASRGAGSAKRGASAHFAEWDAVAHFAKRGASAHSARGVAPAYFVEGGAAAHSVKRGAAVRAEGGVAAARAEGGFTVIELLIAFTILAIVSGSLFQIFYVASANNARAEEYDRANGLAVTAVELFKAEPSPRAGYAVLAYYDADWRELPAGVSPEARAEAALDAGQIGAGLISAGQGDAGLVGAWQTGAGQIGAELASAELAGAGQALPAGSGSGGAGGSDGAGLGALSNMAAYALLGGQIETLPPEGAAYALVSETREEDVPLPPDSNYMLGAAELALGAQENYRIVISEGPGGFEIRLNGLPQAVNSSRIQRAVPINLVFSQSGILPKNVVVVNDTGTPAQISVFGVPGAASGAGVFAALDGGASAAAGSGAGAGAASGAGAAGEPDAPADSGGAAGYISVSAAQGSVGVAYYQGELRAPESRLFRFGAAVL
ncbi:MAG: prepilin-type N-terminal cleavage/methylation domain-containing protein, partial [Clostridiales bacterium]|nr:prepilin-type N-terminal cleavage/methylation domain-containing protein [Clostridiales bacterium]